MITVDFSQRGETGLCEYLYNSIKDQIMDGTLGADSKLPSKRTLASHLGVSVITIQNAYAQLISEGYIYSIEKKGFFVTDISVSNSVQTSVNSVLQSSVPSQSEPEQKKEWFADFTSNATSAQKFPFTLWAHTMRQVLNSSDEKLLQRSGIKGCLDLRTQIARYLKSFRNMNVSPEQIIIGAGTEALYSMLVQFMGRDKVFAVENPGYKKVRDILELNGATCIPVQIDDQGINPEDLEKNNANIVHLSPNHHFPTGIVMPVRRRLELLAWANASDNRFIIEDDYDSEFRFNGKPLPTLQSSSPQSNIIYMNTFTKTLSPSFRISYMVLPVSLVDDFVTKLGSYSCQVSAFEQFTLARFMEEGNYETHINRMKNYYRSLRNSFITELEKSQLMPSCKIAEEESGLHFLLYVNSRQSPAQLKQNLNNQGINISLLSDYFYGDSNSNQAVFVINYSGIKKELISSTIHRIENALLNI